MHTQKQPRTLTNCPELLLIFLRKCAWVNHLFTTCLGEKLLEIASDHSNLWPRKLRKIAYFRKSPENSKMLETRSGVGLSAKVNDANGSMSFLICILPVLNGRAEIEQIRNEVLQRHW
jgi:hypothetical protein